MKLKDSFHPYALITIICWSLAYVYTRLGLEYFSSPALGFLRYLSASVIMAGVALICKIKPPAISDWPWFLLSGASGFFLYMLSFNKGLETVTAATSSLIVATVPIITALLARAFYKEKLKGYQIGAIAVEFIGIVLLTALGGTVNFNTGILWLLLASVFLGSYNVIQRKLTRTYTALQASTYSIFAGTLMLFVFSPAAFHEAARAPVIQWLYVAILGIFSSAVAYICWAVAFAKADKTSYVSNYMFVTPFLTSIMGFFMINEIPDIPTIVGGAVILGGVFLFNKESLTAVLRHKASDK